MKQRGEFAVNAAHLNIYCIEFAPYKYTIINNIYYYPFILVPATDSFVSFAHAGSDGSKSQSQGIMGRTEQKNDFSSASALYFVVFLKHYTATRH